MSKYFKSCYIILVKADKNMKVNFLYLEKTPGVYKLTLAESKVCDFEYSFEHPIFLLRECILKESAFSSPLLGVYITLLSGHFVRKFIYFFVFLTRVHIYFMLMHTPTSFESGFYTWLS